MKHYRELIAWQKAMELVEEVYRASRAFPPDEKYGLTSQVRRAAVSVPSNIAEGHARPKADLIRFPEIARGLLSEMETQVEIAIRLDFVRAEEMQCIFNAAGELGRIIKGSFAP